MIAVLATGKLIRDPVRRVSAKGIDYATCLLSVPTDEEPALVGYVQDTCKKLSLRLSKVEL